MAFSNPPYVRGEKDIPIAVYEGNLKGKERYREYLAEKYGKKKMLFSGIHFNFSFSEEMLKKNYQYGENRTYQEYKNSVYLDLVGKVTEFSWLIVYLTAASPVMDGSFFKEDAVGKDILSNYASVRCGENGYWNEFLPLLDYTSLDSYIQSIQNYVDHGKLRAASELYYPVRLKAAGENSLENLKRSGVNHIELRMLDLNPFSPVGILKEDLQFLHVFLIYLLTLEHREFETFRQIMAIKNEKRAAEYQDEKIWIETRWNQVLSTYEYKRLIKANDRATMLNLMVGLNGYTLCSGMICEELNGSEYRAVPLDADANMTIRYISRKGMSVSPLGIRYLEEIRKYVF